MIESRSRGADLQITCDELVDSPLLPGVIGLFAILPPIEEAERPPPRARWEAMSQRDPGPPAVAEREAPLCIAAPGETLTPGFSAKRQWNLSMSFGELPTPNRTHYITTQVEAINALAKWPNARYKMVIFAFGATRLERPQRALERMVLRRAKCACLYSRGLDGSEALRC